MSGELVTVHDCVDAGITLGLSARRTLEITRELGYRIATQDWHRLWREQMARRGYSTKAAV